MNYNINTFCIETQGNNLSRIRLALESDYVERAADAVHEWKHMEHSSGDDEDFIPLHTRLFTLRPKLCLY